MPMSDMLPICWAEFIPLRAVDHKMMVDALRTIADQDPSFRVLTDPESGNTTVESIGWLPIEIIGERLGSEFNVPVRMGLRQVSHRETIRNSAEGEGQFIRPTGSLGSYAHVKLRVEPNPTGVGFEFPLEASGEALPAEYAEAALGGVQEALKGGVLAGHPMIDIKVTVLGGSYHRSDSNAMAFKIAGSLALKEAARRANPILLEPVMALEVVTPEEFVGTVINDLNARRGRMGAIEHREGTQIVKATVPLVEMFDYSRTLRLSTQSRATYSMRFHQYEQVPKGYDLGDETSGVVAKKPRAPTLGHGARAADIPLDG
jgi:elongation factor G